ncbi:MAG: hypothetical protein U5K74_04375 [Gemmatimonadaceae bacterium]|nr:hypothetical protein [Gemmatimonadaceae bacterium]
MRPDEIHFVIPAGMRPDVAASACATHDAMRPTHQLLTKLDDVPDDTGVR